MLQSFIDLRAAQFTKVGSGITAILAFYCVGILPSEKYVGTSITLHILKLYGKRGVSRFQGNKELRVCLLQANLIKTGYRTPFSYFVYQYPG